MTIIELPQGYYKNLSGMDAKRALTMFIADDLVFLEKHPQCKPYHRPSWRQFEAKDTATAPWGYEWYEIDTEGKLNLHSADYDSSG